MFIADISPPPSYEAVFRKVKQLKDESMERVGCSDDIRSKTCGAGKTSLCPSLFLLSYSVFLIGCLASDVIVCYIYQTYRMLVV